MSPDKSTERGVDATVSDTFPASDPPEGTPEGGVRLDPEPLRAARSGSMALRHLLVAGLQAAHAASSASADALRALTDQASAPELRGVLGELLAASEGQRLRLARALAFFGESRRPGLETARSAAVTVEAARAETPGPALDVAIATSARQADLQHAATCDVLAPLAEALDAPEVVRLLHESTAEARASGDRLARLGTERLVPAALRDAQAPLAERTSLSVFGTRIDAGQG